MSGATEESLEDFQAFLQRHLMASDDKGRYIIDKALEKRENGTEKHLDFLRVAFEETGLSVYLFALAIYEGRWRLKVVTPPPLDKKIFPLPEIYRFLKPMPRLLYVNITATTEVLTEFFSNYHDLVAIPKFREFWSDLQPESCDESSVASVELSDLGQSVKELKAYCREMREFRDEITNDVRDDIERELRGDIKRELRGQIKKKLNEEIDKELREEIKKELREDLKKELSEQIKKELGEDLIKELNEEIEKKLNEEIDMEISEQTKKEISEEIKNKLNEEIDKELREEIKKELREDLKNELREDIKKELREELKNELGEDMKKELREDIKSDLREDIISDVQREFKERFVEATKGSVEAKQIDIKMKRLTELERNVETALSEIEELPDMIERKVKRRVERQLREQLRDEITQDVADQLKEFRNAMNK